MTPEIIAIVTVGLPRERSEGVHIFPMVVLLRSPLQRAAE